MSYPCPYCSKVPTSARNLRRHLSGTRPYGGHELSEGEADAVIARVEGRAVGGDAPLPGVATRPSPPVVRRDASFVRAGHRRSLELLENTGGAVETLAMYERATGHPVYLRPTDRGLTVMSLDPETKAMVGVGPAGDCSLQVVPPTSADVEAAARAFRDKAGAMKRDSAEEERYVIARIRAALANGLALDDDLVFLHQEWRFPSGDKIDVLALDVRTGQLVVIEAKKSEAAALRERDGEGRTAAEQAAEYVAQLVAHASECMPFFQRLASAMSRIYRPSAEELRVEASLPPRWEVWWPEGRNVQPVARTSAADVVDVAYVSSDAAWQRVLRRRQSRWREQRAYPIGLHDGRPLGSRLAMPAAEEKLWNFLTPAIGELVRREYLANASRPAAQKSLYGYPRLFADLLSSQPLAFNLFGELAIDLARATVAARRLWPDRVDTVTRIAFEWSPGRWDQRYLNNGTAADVAIFHTTPSGGSGIVFVETKYHEDLRGKDYEVKPRHLEVARASRAFVEDGLEQVRSGTLQQLWFDHLLALATRDTDALESALFVVIYPEINERCRDAVNAYRGVLDANAPRTFEARTLEEVVTTIGDAAGEAWASAFRERYLDTYSWRSRTEPRESSNGT